MSSFLGKNKIICFEGDYAGLTLMEITRERLTSEDKHKSPFLFSRHLTAYQFCFSYSKGKTVLDLGCGDGYGTYLISKRAKKVIGVDIDKGTIALAKQRFKAKNLQFLVADVLNLPFLNKFDVVVSLQLIEHIKNIKKYLSEIKKRVKKEGKVIFSTPNKELRLGKGEKPWNSFHVQEYALKDFKLLLKKHFSQVAIFGLRASPEVYNLEMKRIFLRRIVARLDILNLYRHVPKQLTDYFLRIMKSLLGSKNKRRKKTSYWVSKENSEKVLDFIAVCQR